MRFAGFGATLGGLSVIFGAFGAHALSGRLTESALAIYRLAAQYQMYHAVALLGLAALPAVARAKPARGFRAAGWCWVAGTVIFSGSLYLLALTGYKAWGAVTPIGGLLLIAGWATLAVTCMRYQVGK